MIQQNFFKFVSALIDLPVCPQKNGYSVSSVIVTWVLWHVDAKDVY